MLKDGKARVDAGPKSTQKKGEPPFDTWLTLIHLFVFGSLLTNVTCVFLHTDMFLAPPTADSDGESDGSDRVPVPSFQNSFSQAFEQALSQLDNGNQTPAQALPIPGEKNISVHYCWQSLVSVRYI